MRIRQSEVSPLSEDNFASVKDMVTTFKDVLPYWVNTFVIGANHEMDSVCMVEEQKSYGQFILEVHPAFFSIIYDEALVTIAHEIAHTYTLPTVNLTMKILVDDVGMDADDPMKNIIQRVIVDAMERSTEELAHVFMKLVIGEK